MLKRSWTDTQGASRIQSVIMSLGLVALVFLGMRVGQCLPVRPLNVVEITMGRDVVVRPTLAPKGGDTFAEMVKRAKPYAAVNGTFYDENLRPLGDVVADGKVIHRGIYRNGVAFKSNGQVDFLRVSKGRISWRGYTAGVAAGPRLIHGGKVSLDPVADGFRRRSLTLSALRTGIGKTKGGKLLLVTSKQPMTFAEFAKAMLDLGAVEALNLDGGGACGLYGNGKFISQPYLAMTNVIMVHKKSK